jgi:hypothetical protein
MSVCFARNKAFKEKRKLKATNGSKKEAEKLRTPGARQKAPGRNNNQRPDGRSKKPEAGKDRYQAECRREQTETGRGWA